MKLNSKSLYKKEFFRQRLFITALIVVFLTSMSVGYALYQEEFKAEGEVFVEAAGYLTAVGARTMGMSNVLSPSVSWDTIRNNDLATLETKVNVTASSSATSGKEISVTYMYTIYNNSGYEYTYTGFDYEATRNGAYLSISSPVVSGIYVGDKLRPGGYAYVTVRYYLTNAISANQKAEITSRFKFDSGDSDVVPGSLQTYIADTELALNDKNMASVEASILNLFDSGVEYEILSSNGLVTIADSSGNYYDYGGRLDVGDKAEYTFYFKVSPYADLTQDIKTTITARTLNGLVYTIGEITLYKEDNPTWRDASVTFKVDAVASDPNHHIVGFTVTNNGEEEMTEWTAYIYLSNDIEITDFSNDKSSVIYVPGEHLIKISSLTRDGSKHNSLLPGASINLSDTIIGMDETDLLVNKVIVYQKGETFTSGWDYTA